MVVVLADLAMCRSTTLDLEDMQVALSRRTWLLASLGSSLLSDHFQSSSNRLPERLLHKT